MIYTYENAVTLNGVDYHVQLKMIAINATNANDRVVFSQVTGELVVPGFDTADGDNVIVEYTIINSTTGLPEVMDEINFVIGDVDGQTFNSLKEIVGAMPSEYSSATITGAGPDALFEGGFIVNTGGGTTTTADFTTWRQTNGTPIDNTLEFTHDVSLKYQNRSSFSILYGLTRAGANVSGDRAFPFRLFETVLYCDSDGDTIPDYLDLDSDNDGCPDAIEGGDSHVWNDIDANSMLTEAVDTDVTSATYGVPGGTTQGVGTSADASQQAAVCNECLETTHPNFIDNDGDGIGNQCDLDDDNDGILDTSELDCGPFVLNTSSISSGSPNVTDVVITGAHTFNGTLDAASNDSGTPNGLANGALGFGVIIDSDTGNHTDFMEYTIDFSTPVILAIQQAEINGFFDDSEEWTITSVGGSLNLTSPDITNPLINHGAGGTGPEIEVLLGNNTNSIKFRPFTFGGHIDPVDSQWSLVSNDFVTSITIRYKVSELLFNSGIIQRGPIGLSVSCIAKDTDGDLIPDYLDNDSDNDGCPDALEGDSSYGWSDIDSNTMLTAAVDTNPTSATYGLPGSTSQNAGTSIDDTQQAAVCNECLETTHPNFIDNDGDGIGNQCDFDDDNDGILDADEKCEYNSELVTNGSFDASTGWTLNLNDIIDERVYHTYDSNTSAADGFFTQTVSGMADNCGNLVLNFDLFFDSTTGVNHKVVVVSIDGTNYASIGMPGTASGINSVTPIGVGVTTSQSAVVSGVVNNLSISIPYGLINTDSAELRFQFTNCSGCGSTARPDSYIDNISLKASDTDTDGDTIPDCLDNDSDNDGCPDALEGSDANGWADIDTNTMLTAAVDTNPASATYGVPGSISQTPGTSTDATQQAAVCNECLEITHPHFIDNDGDGIGNQCDLDDDNDGVLDVNEVGNNQIIVSNTSFDGGDSSGWALQNMGLFNDGIVGFGQCSSPDGSATYDLGCTTALISEVTLDFAWNNSNVTSSCAFPDEPSNKDIEVLIGGITYAIIRTPSDGSVNADDATDQGGDAIAKAVNGASFTGGVKTIVINHSPFQNWVTTTIQILLPNPVVASDFGLLVSGTGADDVFFDNINATAICATDTDTDNTPDYLDNDSDNDGCPDVLESGGNDPDGDGIIGETPYTFDTDGLVTGTNVTGDYDGVTGNEIKATKTTIDTAPTNQTAISGNNVTFTSAASATSATTFIGTAPNTTPDYDNGTDVSTGLSYQWQEDSGSGFVDIANGGIYGGALTANLTLTGVTPTINGYSYKVLIMHTDNVCNEEATAELTVHNKIIANNDDFSATPIDGTNGGNTATVFTDDTIEGTSFTNSEVLTTVTDNDGIAGLSINIDGTLSIPANTDADTYKITYQICEAANINNCDTAVVDIVIDNKIIANDDDFSATPINTNLGGNTPSVFTDDTIDGNTFVNADVIPTIVDNNGIAGLTMNPDGTFTIPANTDAGTYSISYQICEASNTDNCDTAIVEIIVMTDVDNNGVVDTIDLDDDNDGILDTVECGMASNWDTSGGANDITLTANGTIAELSLTQTGGVITSVGANSIVYTENVSIGTSTYTLTSDTPLTNLKLSFRSIGYINGRTQPLTGNFTLTLEDGTVLNNSNFNSLVGTLPGFDGLSSNDIETPLRKTIVGGVNYFTDATFTDADGTVSTSSGDNSQAYGIIDFTVVLAGRGVMSISYDVLGAGASTAVLGVNANILKDTDGDSIADCLDLDSDNDGIYDVVEAGGVDTNNDGYADDNDDNADNTGSNGIPTSATTGLTPTETTTGTPDYLNTDSDGDGCSDAIEAGFEDDDKDGGLGDAPIAVDANGMVTSATGYTKPTETTTGTSDYQDDSVNSCAAIDLIKTAILVDTNMNGIDDAGDTINYSFTIKNTGTVNLKDVVITDVLATVTPTTTIDLIAGATDNTTYKASYVITQANVNAGSFSNTATVSGKDSSGNTVSDVSDDPSETDDVDPDGDGNPDDPTVIEFDQEPSISLLKTGVFEDTSADGFPQAGEKIRYSFTVKNTGNVSLTGVTITDPLVTVSGGPIDLEPGASNTTTFFALYTLKQTDIDNRSISNAAVVTAKDPNNANVTDNSDDPNNATDIDDNADGDPDDDTVIALAKTASIELFKTGAFVDTNTDGLGQIGETMKYIFDVRNTGNVTLTDILITDPLGTVVGGPITLAPGATNNTSFTFSYPITQDDINAGSVTNRATVNSKDPDDVTVTDDSDDPTNLMADDATVIEIATSPKVFLFKTSKFNDENGDTFADADETITFTFDVRNTGNVALDNVIVTDPLVTVTGSAITLAPGEFDDTTFSATYTLTQDDVEAGMFENQAEVVAEDNTSATITAISDFSDDPNNPVNIDLDMDGNPDDPTVTDLPANPSINLLKAATFNDENNDGKVQVGETIG